MISKNVKKNLRTPLKNLYQIQQEIKRKQTDSQIKRFQKESQKLKQTIGNINNFHSFYQHHRERKLLQIGHPNLDYYDIQQIQEAFKNNETFVFKITNFDLQHPVYNLNFMNDREEEFITDVNWNDDDFKSDREFALYLFLLETMRKCFFKTREQAINKAKEYNFFYDIVKNQMEGCPTVIMTFMEVIDNFRKYFLNIKQNFILTNFNMIKIEHYSYFELSNDINLDKQKMNIYIFQEALNKSEGKGFNFDDYFIYYKRFISYMTDILKRESKKSEEIKYFLSMIRAEKIYAVYCHFLSLVQEMTLIDQAISKWSRKQRMNQDEIVIKQDQSIINYEKNVWQKRALEKYITEIQKQKIKDEMNSKNIQEKNKADQQQKLEENKNEELDKNDQEQNGNDSDQTGSILQNILKRKVEIQNQIVDAELMADQKTIKELEKAMDEIKKEEKILEDYEYGNQDNKKLIEQINKDTIDGDKKQLQNKISPLQRKEVIELDQNEPEKNVKDIVETNYDEMKKLAEQKGQKITDILQKEAEQNIIKDEQELEKINEELKHSVSPIQKEMIKDEKETDKNLDEDQSKQEEQNIILLEDLVEKQKELDQQQQDEKKIEKEEKQQIQRQEEIQNDPLKSIETKKQEENLVPSQKDELNEIDEQQKSKDTSQQVKQDQDEIKIKENLKNEFEDYKKFVNSLKSDDDYKKTQSNESQQQPYKNQYKNQGKKNKKQIRTSLDLMLEEQLKLRENQADILIKNEVTNDDNTPKNSIKNLEIQDKNQADNSVQNLVINNENQGGNSIQNMEIKDKNQDDNFILNLDINDEKQDDQNQEKMIKIHHQNQENQKSKQKNGKIVNNKFLIKHQKEKQEEQSNQIITPVQIKEEKKEIPEFISNRFKFQEGLKDPPYQKQLEFKSTKDDEKHANNHRKQLFKKIMKEIDESLQKNKENLKEIKDSNNKKKMQQIVIQPIKNIHHAKNTQIITKDLKMIPRQFKLPYENMTEPKIKKIISEPENSSQLRIEDCNTIRVRKLRKKCLQDLRRNILF